jgi:hypothetical protein
MTFTPPDATSQGKGELLRALLNNLGLPLVGTSMGDGELLASIADAAAAIGPASDGPSNAIAATMPRNNISSDSIAIASGTIQAASVYLTKGMVVNNIVWASGGTAGATLNHQWAVLLNSSLKVVAATADATSAAIAAHTAYTLPLTAAYTVPTSGIYYIGLMVSNNAGTEPTATGTSAANAFTNNLAPKAAGTSSTGQTTPLAVGATATAITATADTIYAYLT